MDGVIRLRYPAVCSTCGAKLASGTTARWAEKQATCLDCLEPKNAEVDRGTAGASAAREWKRRHERREEAVRQRYGPLGGIVLALGDDPYSTNAWAYGANGERALGRVLDPLRERGMAVLHDRRIPGSRANIDHLVVSAGGVYVVDAKNYRGRVEKRDRGGWFTQDERLYVGGRDKTALIGGMARQAAAVGAALGQELPDAPITKVICFTAADWPFFAKPLRFDDVHVLWADALLKLVATAGPLTAELVARVERQLAVNLPPA